MYGLPSSKVLINEVLEECGRLGYNGIQRFKAILHVTPNQLDVLVSLIQSSQHFQSKDGWYHQEPVQTQLKVALSRLGFVGISLEKVSHDNGVGSRSVYEYTNHCIATLDDLAPQFIVWPNQEAISQCFLEHKGFPDAIGAVDSMFIRFAEAPSYDTISWNMYKCMYAMGMTAVCDHEGLFTYILHLHWLCWVYT